MLWGLLGTRLGFLRHAERWYWNVLEQKGVVNCMGKAGTALGACAPVSPWAYKAFSKLLTAGFVSGPEKIPGQGTIIPHPLEK